MQIYKVDSIQNLVQDRSQKDNANFTYRGKLFVDNQLLDVAIKVENQARLAKELISDSLANALNVPHAQGFLASIDNSLIRGAPVDSCICDPENNNRSLVFASSWLDKGFIAPSGGMADSNLIAEYNASVEALLILIFDELIANHDRVYENIGKLENGFAAIDHDKVFFGDKVSFNDLSTFNSEVQCMVSDSVASLGNFIPEYIEKTVSDLIQLMPGELRILEELLAIGLIEQSEVDSIDSFLAARIKDLPNFVLGRFERNQ